jgi:hypothetical protein
MAIDSQWSSILPMIHWTLSHWHPNSSPSHPLWHRNEQGPDLTRGLFTKHRVAAERKADGMTPKDFRMKASNRIAGGIGMGINDHETTIWIHMLWIWYEYDMNETSKFPNTMIVAYCQQPSAKTVPVLAMISYARNESNGRHLPESSMFSRGQGELSRCRRTFFPQVTIVRPSIPVPYLSR